MLDMLLSAVVYYNAVYCSAMKCSAVQCSAGQCISVLYHAVQLDILCKANIIPTVHIAVFLCSQQFHTGAVFMCSVLTGEVGVKHKLLTQKHIHFLQCCLQGGRFVIEHTPHSVVGSAETAGSATRAESLTCQEQSTLLLVRVHLGVTIFLWRLYWVSDLIRAISLFNKKLHQGYKHTTNKCTYLDTNEQEGILKL